MSLVCEICGVDIAEVELAHLSKDMRICCKDCKTKQLLDDYLLPIHPPIIWKDD